MPGGKPWSHGRPSLESCGRQMREREASGVGTAKESWRGGQAEMVGIVGIQQKDPHGTSEKTDLKAGRWMRLA